MILDKFKLTGKVAIVTGAGRGLGQGAALGFAEAGADLALVDVLKQKGQNGNSIRSLNEYMDELPWKKW